MYFDSMGHGNLAYARETAFKITPTLFDSRAVFHLSFHGVTLDC
jgi:hypothetical protein